MNEREENETHKAGETENKGKGKLARKKKKWERIKDGKWIKNSGGEEKNGRRRKREAMR